MNAPLPPKIQWLIDSAVWKIMKSVDDAITAERARCAAKCRAIAAENSEQSYLIGATALRCAEAIERDEG